MSKSVHNIEIRGMDKSAAAFASIKARAAAAMSQIKSIVGGALAGAGAYLGFRALSGTVQDLGNLSDIAMKAGTSVDDLTRASNAFQMAGLNMSVENLGRAFQFMQKNTGQSGMDAFLKTAKSIAEMGDGAERGAALVKAFGRAGMELQPLVNGGAEVVEKFATLASLMPHVTQAAADAGDAVADAQKTLGVGVQSLWRRAIGKICAMWADDFPGGVRAGALNAVNWVEYAMKLMWNKVTKWGAKIATFGQAIWNWAANGYTWEQAMNEWVETDTALNEQMDNEAARIEKARADYVAKLKEANVDDLANLFGKNPRASGRNLGEGMGEGMAKSMKQVRNDLVMAGSNAALKMQLLGPSYESEQKKQTSILEKIAANTEKTADNTDVAVDDDILAMLD